MDTGVKVSEPPDTRKSSFPLVFPPREGQGGQTYLPAAPGLILIPPPSRYPPLGSSHPHPWGCGGPARAKGLRPPRPTLLILGWQEGPRSCGSVLQQRARRVCEGGRSARR